MRPFDRGLKTQARIDVSCKRIRNLQVINRTLICFGKKKLPDNKNKRMHVSAKINIVFDSSDADEVRFAWLSDFFVLLIRTGYLKLFRKSLLLYNFSFISRCNRNAEIRLRGNEYCKLENIAILSLKLCNKD